MTANPKQELRELIERLSDEEARRLSAALQAAGTTPPPSARPLAAADIVLAEPVLREDETADEMIATVRRWRREGGYV